MDYQEPNFQKFLRIWLIGIFCLLSHLALSVVILYNTSLVTSLLVVILGTLLPSTVWLCYDCCRVRSLGPDPLSTPENIRLRAPQAAPCVLFVITFLGSIFGLFLGSLYVAPWYSLVAFGAGAQIDATVAPSSAHEYSIYTFSPLTAFIDTSRAGYFDSTASIHGRNIVTRTCAAPLVASPMQTRAAFWAIAYGACCDTLTCDQWSNFALVRPKSNTTSAYRALASGNTVWRDTVSMNQAVSVAAANAAAQAVLHPNTSFPMYVDNEPRLFVTLNADPLAFSSKIGISGLVPLGCVIAVWPFIIMLMAFPVELISMLKEGKMFVIDVWILVLFEKRVDSRETLRQLCCPETEDRYRVTGWRMRAARRSQQSHPGHSEVSEESPQRDPGFDFADEAQNSD